MLRTQPRFHVSYVKFMHTWEIRSSSGCLVYGAQTFKNALYVCSVLKSAH